MDGIKGLSRERVGAEMLKLLAAPKPSPSVSKMRSVGLLQLCLPGSDDDALAILEQLESEVDALPDALRRLSVLGGDEAAKALRLSRTQQKMLSVLRDGAASLEAPSELAYRHSAGVARDIVLLRSALAGTNLPSDLEDLIDLGRRSVFPIKARDLMPDYEGIYLGVKLRELEAVWIESNFSMDRSDLLEF